MSRNNEVLLSMCNQILSAARTRVRSIGGYAIYMYILIASPLQHTKSKSNITF